MKVFNEIVNTFTEILSQKPRFMSQAVVGESLSLFDLFRKDKKEPQQETEEQAEAEHNDFSAREIQVYNVLLDRELFRFKGDWAMEEKGKHCTVYYTENGEHKKFEFDMSDHIAVYKDIA